MRIIFFGTSSFAASLLLSLINSKHKLLAIVTQPDRRSGRGLVKSFSPVKLIAQKYDLLLYQPKNIKSHDFLKMLTDHKADIFVVAAFGQILPKHILELPKHYSINIHPSLLPKYRGAAPVNWALLKGEKVTGVTIFRMTEGIDDGDIIAKKGVEITGEDTTLSLTDKLSKVGAELLIEALVTIAEGKAQFTPQHSAEATYAPKLRKADGLIDWNRRSKEIHNHIKGMAPWPAAYTHLDNRLIKVWKVKLLEGEFEDKAEPGTIIKMGREGITVKTKDGAILICELQAESNKKMSTEAYCRGHKVEVGQKFS